MTDNELLFDACKKGQISAINGLLERVLIFKIKAKANVNARDSEGRTPLFYAVRDGHRTIVRTLLVQGAEVNARDKDSATPLSLAVRQGNREIVKFLLAKGADVNAIDASGFDPLSYAVQGDHQEIARMLIDKGAISGTRGKVTKPTAAAAPVQEKTRAPKDEVPGITLDQRLAKLGDVNDFIYDERDRLLTGPRRLDDSTEVVWDLLKEYKLFRGRVVCDNIDKSRAILMYATGEGGLPDMVGEIGWTADGAELVIGGDLRGSTERWFNLVELLSKRRKDLGIVEASFFDMVGETSIFIEKSPQRRLSNIGRALGSRPA